MNNNKWTIITDDPIVLDLTDCKNPDILHKTLRKTFGFPAFYGENWDALWDLLWEMFCINAERRIHIKGFEQMPADMQAYCIPMKQVFSDLHDIRPGVG